MQQSNVHIGETYLAKVTSKLVPVRIGTANVNGGWDAKNLKTGKAVRIKSAQRLRYACDSDGKMVTGKKAAAQNIGTATQQQKETEKSRTKAIKEIDNRLADQPEQKPKTEKPGKMSLLDAAAQILKGNKEPMACNGIVDAAIELKLWTTNGKTPASTLYAALIREIKAKGRDSRFEKTGRGLFALNAA